MLHVDNQVILFDVLWQFHKTQHNMSGNEWKLNNLGPMHKYGGP